MKYNIRLHPKVLKFLDKCSNGLKNRITAKLLMLKEEPFRLLEHYEGNDFYKLRIGDYRALIDIKGNDIFVQVLDHRKRIYKRK